MHRVVILCAAALAASACATDDDEMPPVDGPDAAAPEPDAAAPPGDDAATGPDFDWFVDEVVIPNCSGPMSCHRDTSGEFSLYKYGKIVNAPAISHFCEGWIRVVPGDPDASLLYQKLVQDPAPCGSKMPLSLVPLTDEQIDGIRIWIETGAPR